MSPPMPSMTHRAFWVFLGLVFGGCEATPVAPSEVVATSGVSVQAGGPADSVIRSGAATCLVRAQPLLRGTGEGPEAPGPVFDHSAGLHEGPLTVMIAARGSMRFTLDGSPPTAEHGELAEQCVTLDLDATTAVRAVRLDDDGEPVGPVVTRTFILAETVGQQAARTADSPTPKLSIGGGHKTKLDYEVDVGAMSNLPATEIFGSIPTVSLALAPDALFGERGVLVSGKSGENKEFEHPLSVELFDPAHPDVALQVDAAVRPHSWRSIKRSLKLVFKEEYGASKLVSPIFRYATLNGDGAADVFDRLVLRAGTNRS